MGGEAGQYGGVILTPNKEIRVQTVRRMGSATRNIYWQQAIGMVGTSENCLPPISHDFTEVQCIWEMDADGRLPDWEGAHHGTGIGCRLMRGWRCPCLFRQYFMS